MDASGDATADGQPARPARWRTRVRSWGGRLGLTLAIGLAVLVTRGLWSPLIGKSLVCAGDRTAPDAMLVENFDPDYRVFERAASLQQAGLSGRVFVPAPASAADAMDVHPVSRGIVEVMARFAHVRHIEIIPIHEIEPYSLHAAYQIRDVLVREHVRSVLVLSPAFRSRRSALVYGTVLQPAGIRVDCLAVFGHHTPGNWTASWHGVQIVAEQLIKLGYYRLYVLGLRRP